MIVILNVLKFMKIINTKPKIMTRNLHTFRQSYKNYFDKNIQLYKPEILSIVIYKTERPKWSYKSLP